MRKGKKLVSAALSLAFMAGTAALPVLGHVALAAESDESGITDISSIMKGDRIWFGKNHIYWDVLDAKKTNNNQNGMFLMSNELFGYDNKEKAGSVYFKESAVYTSDWQKSDARKWCQDFAENEFTSLEKNAILATSKKDAAYTYDETKVGFGESALDKDKVFFLSAEEAVKYVNKNDRSEYNGKTWWLRSPTVTNKNFDAGAVLDNGVLGPVRVNVGGGAHPAINIDPNSVLFVSLSSGGKASGELGPDAIIENKMNLIDKEGRRRSKDWRLTLKNPDSSFKIKNVSYEGDGMITISYSIYFRDSGYISGIIKDSKGNITGYGRIAKTISGGGDGTVKVRIPKSGKLYIFTETYHEAGDRNETDYASEPIEIYIPATDITGVPTSATAGTDLKLGGTVAPGSATNQTITWSIKDAGATGAALSGNVLKTKAPGTVKVTATIKNGKTSKTNFTKDYTITVNKTAAQIAAEKKAAEDKAAADAVIKAINNLGVVTKADSATKAKLDKVKAAYDKLTPDQKAMVTNYSAYEVLQKTYDALAKNKPTSAPTDKSSDAAEVEIKGITYKVTSADSKTAAVVKAGTTIKTASIKSSVKIGGESYKVTSIAKNAFKGCTKLTKVSGGANIKTIGSGAFSGCKALKSFSITSKTLKSIGSSAFKGDKKLKTIKVTKTTKLTKKGVKNALKGSSVKTVDVAKKQVKACKKYFAKKNSGAKVTVK